MTSTFCPSEKANMETASEESYVMEESRLNILDHSHIFENRASYVHPSLDRGRFGLAGGGSFSVLSCFEYAAASLRLDCGGGE